LDVGREDNVMIDAPVVAPEGLVGVVRATSRGQALGDYWTHPDFRVSAMTVDGSVFGIISPGESSLSMVLDGAPYQVELDPGTELVTSGMGGVFPRGIPIGRVVEVREEQAGWTKSYLVRPSVNPESVREVMVLVEREPSEETGDAWSRPASEEER
jgi:rod shape-determining protein MreC